MTTTAPLNEEYTTPATAEQLERTAAALRERGFDAHLAPDAEAARALVTGLIPSDAAVLTAASETLRETGVAAEIDESGRFAAIRPELMRLDFRTHAEERRRRGSAPDVLVGSVQAITDDGAIVLASATGTQLGPSAYGAGRVIWVVGAQKLVRDLESALRRVREHCYPLEDERARRVYGQPSTIAKLLIVEREVFPGRIAVVLVAEALGY